MCESCYLIRAASRCVGRRCKPSSPRGTGSERRRQSPFGDRGLDRGLEPDPFGAIAARDESVLRHPSSAALHVVDCSHNRCLRLHSNFNHIGVRSFVLSGAPKSTPLRTKLRTQGSRTTSGQSSRDARWNDAEVENRTHKAHLTDDRLWRPLASFIGRGAIRESGRSPNSHPKTIGPWRSLPRFRYRVLASWRERGVSKLWGFDIRGDGAHQRKAASARNCPRRSKCPNATPSLSDMNAVSADSCSHGDRKRQHTQIEPTRVVCEI